MYYFQVLLYTIAFVYAFSLLWGKKKKEFFFIVSGVLLTLFLGLRDIYTGGIDLLRYNSQYESLSYAKTILAAYEMRSGENILFFSFLFICAKLGLTFQGVLIIVAVLSVSASLLLYYRYSNHPLLCISIFLPTCYIHLFSQLKQTIAVSITIFAYMLLRKNKNLWAYFLLIVAILFHPTAIVMLPIFILCKRRVTSSILLTLFSGSILVYLMRMQLGRLLTLAFYDQYLDYWESTGSITNMAMFFIFFTIFYLITMPKKKVSKEKYLLISTYLYALIIAMTIFFCSSYSYAFTRVNNYFLVFVPLALSEINDFSFWKKRIGSKLPVHLMNGVVIYIMINWFFDMVESQYLDMYDFCFNSIYFNF